ncbi:MAG: hypothetical protein IIB66_01765 [Proteobacteria bacterium]|nr:hypothetical protein [Pseudomonadota bacterium]
MRTAVAGVLHPYARSRPRGRDFGRDPGAALAEAVALAEAIGLDIQFAETASLGAVSPATLLGRGKVEELRGAFAARAIEVVVIDGTLTPVQQRNLERAWGCKVIDRTGLILEIFGERAKTREGRLQVELAALDYQKSIVVIRSQSYQDMPKQVRVNLPMPSSDLPVVFIHDVYTGRVATLYTFGDICTDIILLIHSWR